jgi:hypothetical protein
MQCRVEDTLDTGCSNEQLQLNVSLAQECLTSETMPKFKNPLYAHHEIKVHRAHPSSQIRRERAHPQTESKQLYGHRWHVRLQASSSKKMFRVITHKFG